VEYPLRMKKLSLLQVEMTCFFVAYFADVNEVVTVVLFLLSDGASMVTGSCIPIDGGCVSCLAVWLNFRSVSQHLSAKNRAIISFGMQLHCVATSLHGCTPCNLPSAGFLSFLRNLVLHNLFEIYIEFDFCNSGMKSSNWCHTPL